MKGNERRWTDSERQRTASERTVKGLFHHRRVRPVLHRRQLQLAAARSNCTARRRRRAKRLQQGLDAVEQAAGVVGGKEDLRRQQNRGERR